MVRWDRLFADLEGQAADVELEERDVLVSELRDGAWAETTWRDLVGGHVVLEVAGLGRVEGEARLVNDTLVHLGSGPNDAGPAEYVVAAEAVLEVVRAERRAVPITAVASRLGWGHVLRAARDDGDRAIITRTDGVVATGEVDVVGRDFVVVASGAGRTRTVPFAAIAGLTFSET
jgi:hypothetical protein